jgi:dipeptidyl aminopeptidase/acylaminoacyl peptidase
VDDLQLTPDGRTLIYSEQTGSRPAEIYAAPSGGSPVALTRLNDALLAGYELPGYEEFWVEGAERARVHSFLLKPPRFRPGRKYPVLFLIHGGPQGAWGENWSYRWNAQVFAAAGYVVVMPNPRGSTGYGQKFIDEINQDWGGKPYEDIMAVADYVEKQPYADPDKMAAAGASYGGYMIDWLLGHTVRFKALLSHAGVFDLRSMFGETEELWFPLWEFGGAPWDNPDVYMKWSPSQYVKDFRTPTLVTHGEQDFRVPYGQGMQLFTALQLQKVPSKLVIFPDEGHWILKPQNSLLWYQTALEWIGEWVNKPAPVPAPVPAAVSPGGAQPGVPPSGPPSAAPRP